MRHIQARAQKPSIGQPEIMLGKNRQIGGESAAAQAVGQRTAKPVITSRGQCLLQGHGYGGNAAFGIESGKAILELQGGVAQPRATGRIVHPVIARHRDQPHREAVRHAVEKIGQRYRAIGMWFDFVIEIAFDQDMPLAQGRRGIRQQGSRPPGIVQGLPVRGFGAGG